MYVQKINDDEIRNDVIKFLNETFDYLVKIERSGEPAEVLARSTIDKTNRMFAEIIVKIDGHRRSNQKNAELFKYWSETHERAFAAADSLKLNLVNIAVEIRAGLI
jgi:hypothetical protein